MAVDEQINLLNEIVRKLIVEYDVFFAGGRKRPPTSLKFKADSLVKRLVEERMSYGQKYRYNQIVARYSLYRDLWRRNTRQLEEGGNLRSEGEIEQLIRSRRLGVLQADDQLSVTVKEPSTDTEDIAKLFEYLVNLRERYGERPLHVDFQRFQALVSEKTHEVRTRYRCRAAEFIVFHDPGEKRVRFQVRAKWGDETSPDQTLTGLVYRP